MAIWTCTKCGQTREGRCKPRKCPSCGTSGTDTFVKAEETK